MHHGVWMYVLVFVGKVINNMIATVKMIMLNRGERLSAALLTLVQMTIFLVITSTVLAGMRDNNFIPVIVYVAASMIGNYLGGIIEGKIALGLSSIQVIVPQGNSTDISTADMLAEKLRDAGFAVTILDGEGSRGKRDVLLLHMKRKRIPKAKMIIRKFLANPIIVENEVKRMDGGYLENDR
jgi:uncharacterized protein YebE (UPF0316 family)